MVSDPLSRALGAGRCSPKKANSNKQERALLPMTTIAMNLVGYFQEKREASWETVVRVIFGAFIGSLVLLLILLYAGVPIV